GLSTLSLHDALPIWEPPAAARAAGGPRTVRTGLAVGVRVQARRGRRGGRGAPAAGGGGPGGRHRRRDAPPVVPGAGPVRRRRVRRVRPGRLPVGGLAERRSGRDADRTAP